MPKTLGLSGTAEAQVEIEDLIVIGNGDLFRLLSKVSSEEEGWEKLTEAMYVPGIGCVIHTITQQSENISEALLLVPGTKLENDINDGMKVVKL